MKEYLTSLPHTAGLGPVVSQYCPFLRSFDSAAVSSARPSLERCLEASSPLSPTKDWAAQGVHMPVYGRRRDERFRCPAPSFSITSSFVELLNSLCLGMEIDCDKGQRGWPVGLLDDVLLFEDGEGHGFELVRHGLGMVVIGSE
ncbi:hypothetical protein M0R45_020427 [Rubus argutus]|uniref:Uncharacterized protein n=1 Tax=Rubus argutus TaxID=59490 RepID=A0AAW1XAQ0_RUBAR